MPHVMSVARERIHGGIVLLDDIAAGKLKEIPGTQSSAAFSIWHKVDTE